MVTQNQASFDHVSRALAAQGRPSFVEDTAEGTCLYRGPNGLRCAAGHCFEGVAGVDFMEDKYCTESRIAALLNAAGHNPLFVREMQRIHDDCARLAGGEPSLWLHQWARGMRRLAGREGLSTVVLDAALRARED